MKAYLAKVWAFFTKFEQWGLMGAGGAVVLSLLLDFVGVLPGVAKVFGTVAGLSGAFVVLSLGWRNVISKWVN